MNSWKGENFACIAALEVLQLTDLTATTFERLVHGVHLVLVGLAAACATIDENCKSRRPDPCKWQLAYGLNIDQTLVYRERDRSLGNSSQGGPCPGCGFCIRKFAVARVFLTSTFLDSNAFSRLLNRAMPISACSWTWTWCVQIEAAATCWACVETGA